MVVLPRAGSVCHPTWRPHVAVTCMSLLPREVRRDDASGCVGRPGLAITTCFQVRAGRACVTAGAAPAGARGPTRMRHWCDKVASAPSSSVTDQTPSRRDRDDHHLRDTADDRHARGLRGAADRPSPVPVGTVRHELRGVPDGARARPAAGRRHRSVRRCLGTAAHNWTDPENIVLTTTESNLWSGASGCTYTFTPRADDGTDVHAVVVVRARTSGARSWPA